ncbi:MAG TPA: alpha/beta hydrolase [Allosphingosinicella sp.]|jgi:pimeloyl-ACP methyl ester carboxylesterase|uniref:alpha/beta fold hydrolase n=1 Tax=Allosphingosinicella sp. TaxID=2823234 RepID=UPI002F295531
MDGVRHLHIGGGRRLSYALTEGRGPTLVFLPGYMSDMEGTKALALAAWAEAEGRAMVRFDYGGCGASSGEFEAQTLAGWRDDTLSIIDMLTDNPAVLVGSSMGGWLMLLVALAWPERIAGLVGIAAAPDFTAWGYTPDEKMTILREGRLERPSDYAETPYVTSRAFWESGEALRLLHAEIAIDCPVRLLHGQADPDVPWAYSLELSKKVRSADVQAILVKDGDHRLSRPQDIALLIATVRTLLEAP